MEVTPSGIVIEGRLTQSRKALYPMDVTLFPKVTLERFEHPQNVPLSIEVTPLPMVIEVRRLQPAKVRVPR
jgi:hypothetical protein